MNIRCSITYSRSPYRNTLWATREQGKYGTAGTTTRRLAVSNDQVIREKPVSNEIKKGREEEWGGKGEIQRSLIIAKHLGIAEFNRRPLL